jgi:hypothetical protein
MPGSRSLGHRGRRLACCGPARRRCTAEQVRVPARHHPHHPAGQPAGQRHHQHQRHQPDPPPRLLRSGRLVPRCRPGAPPSRPAIGPVTPVAGPRPPHLGSRHRPPDRLRGPRNLQRMPDRRRRGSLHRSLDVPEHVPTRLQSRRSLRRQSRRRVLVPVPRITRGKLRRLRRPRRRRIQIAARRLPRRKGRGPPWRAKGGRVQVPLLGLTRRNDRGPLGGPPAGSVDRALRTSASGRGNRPLRSSRWRLGVGVSERGVGPLAET